MLSGRSGRVFESATAWWNRGSRSDMAGRNGGGTREVALASTVLLRGLDALDLLDQLVRPRRLLEHLGTRVVVDGDAELLGDRAQDREHPRVLLLGEQVDLQVELVAALADLRGTVLAHEDEGREEDGLERDDER